MSLGAFLRPDETGLLVESVGAFKGSCGQRFQRIGWCLFLRLATISLTTDPVKAARDRQAHHAEGPFVEHDDIRNIIDRRYPA